MKNNRLNDFMSLADDQYIVEADPTRPSPLLYSRSKFKWSTFFAIASCLLLVLNLVIFLPYLNRDDQSTTTTTTVPPVVDNTDGFNQIQNPSGSGNSSTGGNTTVVDKNALFDALDNLFESGSQNEDFEDEINGDSILGGDIFQKTSTHIFYLRNKELVVYDITSQSPVAIMPLAGYIDEMAELARSLTGLPSQGDGGDNYAFSAGWEMIITPDQKNLVILAKGGSYPVTGVFSYDISRAPTLKLNSFKIFSGEAVGASMTQKGLLIFTSYQIARTYDKEKPTTYMPFYRQNGEDILAGNIFFPKEINTCTYLSAALLDTRGDKVLDSSAYLSYSGLVYASDSNIFITRPVFTGDSSIDYKNPPYKTEITAFSYGESAFATIGTVSVNGYIKSGKHLDQMGTTLRVATTSYIEKSNSATVWYEKSVSLFLIDTENMELLSKAENICAEREHIFCVTFEGNYVYILTTEDDITVKNELMVDTTDKENITYEQQTPSAPQKTLLEFGNGYLIYVGAGSNSQTLKIEVYRRTASDLVCTYELANTYFPSANQAFLIDISKKLIGFAARSYTQGAGYEDKYFLLSFNKEQITPAFVTSLDYKDKNTVRSFTQNGALYVITDTVYISFDINGLVTE